LLFKSTDILNYLQQDISDNRMQDNQISFFLLFWFVMKSKHGLSITKKWK